jgi:hypothetical protein
MTRRPSSDRPAATGPARPLSLLSRLYSRGGRSTRAVLVAVDQADVWFVYDVPAGSPRAKTGLLVERLGGFDDRLDSALALAADYLACQTEFHSGARDEFTCPDPLPKASRVQLAVIRADAARAQRIVRNQQQQHQTAA